MKPGQAEQAAKALKALYGPPLSEEERREYESAKAEAMARDLTARDTHAEYRDCLEFALAYGFSGTPKYQREAVQCLKKALALLSSEVDADV